MAPTRADCTPMAFAEANFYGVPVISTDTGGVASVVKQGVNGAILPLSAGAQDYAELIRTIWLNKSGYETLRKRSREQFETVLNWSTWARQTGQIVRRLQNSADRPFKVSSPAQSGVAESASDLDLGGSIMAAAGARTFDFSGAARAPRATRPRA